MSRLGKKPIVIESDVTVEKQDRLVTVKGPKGEISMTLDPEIDFDINENVIQFQNTQSDDKHLKMKQGLAVALLKNHLHGVKHGYVENMELVGIGYRVQLQGSTLKLNLGYSHDVTFDAPEGIKFEVDGTTKIAVTGIDKYLVGQTASNLSKLRKPDAYKGKGIRFQDRLYRLKAGKSVKK